MAIPVLYLTRQGLVRAALGALIFATLPAGGCAQLGGPVITLSKSKDAPGALTISGLDGRTLDSFAAMEPEQRQAVLQVRVADAPPGAPSLLGEVMRRGGNLEFVPRYPYQPGLKYRARFDPAAFASSGSGAAAKAPMVMEFMIPAPPRDPVVRVAAIYPSSDELPENLLKFYIHFSGPMSRGEAYQRVHLLNDAGEPVAKPFLELGEELWNPEMTRFTLFFDPGRIKQGLVPRLEMGPALESGRSYALVVDAAWEDGEHRPLLAPARKQFRVGPPDTVQPDPARWRITPPPAGSTQSLVIRFDEALDHALLQRVLTVRDSSGQQVAGKATIGEHEQGWSFTPEKPWRRGRHVVAVETILEDNAGNSIGRPFEVDLKQSAEPTGPATIEIPVDIS